MDDKSWWEILWQKRRLSRGSDQMTYVYITLKHVDIREVVH